MDKYYYLIAQLPELTFGEEPDISKNSFLEEAGKWLSFSDLKNLREAELDNLREPHENGMLKRYFDFEQSLRSELAEYRRSRGGEKKEHRSRLVLSADLLEGNPLEVEKKLFFLRWQMIEDIAAGHVFSREAVFAYFLRLQILCRMSEFNKEKGKEEFNKLIEVKDEQIR